MYTCSFGPYARLKDTDRPSGIFAVMRTFNVWRFCCNVSVVSATQKLMNYKFMSMYIIDFFHLGVYDSDTAGVKRQRHQPTLGFHTGSLSSANAADIRRASSKKITAKQNHLRNTWYMDHTRTTPLSPTPTPTPSATTTRTTTPTTTTITTTTTTTTTTTALHHKSKLYHEPMRYTNTI